MMHRDDARHWRWLDEDQSVGDPRRRAVIQAVVMGLIGLLLDRWLGRHVMAIVVWVLAAAVLLSGFVAPAALAAVERLGRALGRVVGAILTWVLLVPVFALVFVPAGLFLRLRGRDPMQRGRRRAGLSYWIPRRTPRDPADYHRQFLVEDRAARDEIRAASSAEKEGGA